MPARDHQNEIAGILKDIFVTQSVKTEWDSVRYDPHTGNHKRVYAPRHDIAVGPFNSYWDLDIGVDNTKIMLHHPLTKKLYRDFLRERDTLRKIWNSKSRCYLAIEIEFSGSSKHMLSSIVNASVSGSIGIVIVKEADIDKADRLCNYLMRLEDFGYLKMNMLRNLIIFEDDVFLKFLSAFGISS